MLNVVLPMPVSDPPIDDAALPPPLTTPAFPAKVRLLRLVSVPLKVIVVPVSVSELPLALTLPAVQLMVPAPVPVPAVAFTLTLPPAKAVCKTAVLRVDVLPLSEHTPATQTTLPRPA